MVPCMQNKHNYKSTLFMGTGNSFQLFVNVLNSNVDVKFIDI